MYNRSRRCVVNNPFLVSELCSIDYCKKNIVRTINSVMPRSHIHGIPRRFYYGSNLTDDPGNANFCSPIRMHNVVTTGFGVRKITDAKRKSTD